MDLIIHQAMKPIFPGEPFHQVVLVLSDAFAKVAAHPDVERSIPLAGQDVHTGLLFHEASTGLRPWYPSFLRRNPPKHPPSLSELRPSPTVVGYGRRRSEGPPFAFIHGLLAVVLCEGG